MQAEDVCPDRSWQSMKNRFNTKILPNLANFDVTRAQLMKIDEAKSKGVMRATKPTGPAPYAKADSEAILNYIVKNQDYGRVGGRSLWVEMEAKEVVSDRSWQSLKEHFRKVIMRKIASFHFLTLEQRSKLEAKNGVKVNKEDEKEDAESEELDGAEGEELGELGLSEDETNNEVEEVHVSYILVDS